MGVLDDLKKKAATAKAEEVQRQTQSQDVEAAYRNTIQPRMRALYDYLRELVANLQVVRPDLSLTYEVKGVGTFRGMGQTDYRLETEDQESLKKFALHFNCVTGGQVTVKTGTRTATEQLREYLWAHNLKFKIRAAGDGSGTFVVERMVPVSFEFEADVEKMGVRARVRNLDGVGSLTSMFSADAIDEQFMEELAKCVLREENRFRELTGNTVSDDVRSKLRAQIEARKQSRERELTVPRKAADPAAPQRKTGLLNHPIGKGLFGKK